MRYFFAAADLVTALLVVVAVFLGLPTRWWPIDAAGVIVAASLVISGFALVRQVRITTVLVRACCGVVLGIGLALVAVIAISASHLAGIYGPVGRGSALLLLLVAALAIPYLIALPAAQIAWIKK